MSFVGFLRSAWSRAVEALRAYTHPRRRRNLLPAFLTRFPFTEEDTCLDAGGPTHGFEGLSQISDHVFSVNMDFTELNFLCEQLDKITKEQAGKWISADVCHLPFRDKSFDYVISNDTLEHIPQARWLDFATEVKRVARKGYFISVPNYWYFIEPHYFLPVIHWLPGSMRKPLITKEIRLVKRSELRQLFPDATIFGLGWKLMPYNLVAYVTEEPQTL